MLNKTRLLTPGPTPLPERVRLALAGDMIHHRTAAFRAVMTETQTLLKQLFGTCQPVLPLSCSGSGAMTAAVHGLFAPGEKVIVVNGGKFGERWGLIAETRGLQVVRVDVEWGQAVTPAAVEAALRHHPDAKGVLIQLSETSTGVLHPVEAVARLTRTRDVLLVVDGISAVGISPCPMDEWGLDCVVTGSQKGLMTPPGLALLAFSERAWKRAEQLPVSCFYFNLPGERDNLAKGQGMFTSPVNLVQGLRESLHMIFESGGLEAVYRKQWALTLMTREGIKALGLAPFAPNHFTWGLTSVSLPAGIDGVRLLSIAASEHGVVMAGGEGHARGRMVRVGHMGWVDWSDVAAGLYALARAYMAVGGHLTSRDYLEAALAAYRAALEVPPGRAIPPVRS